MRSIIDFSSNDMVAGRNVETAALVVSLRTFIREVLDVDAIPADVSIPKQGPLRPAGAASRSGRGERGGGADKAGKGGARGDGAGAGGVGATHGLEGPSASDHSGHP